MRDHRRSPRWSIHWSRGLPPSCFWSSVGSVAVFVFRFVLVLVVLAVLLPPEVVVLPPLPLTVGELPGSPGQAVALKVFSSWRSFLILVVVVLDLSGGGASFAWLLIVSSSVSVELTVPPTSSIAFPSWVMSRFSAVKSAS